jgi:hypothetical protein
MDTVKIVQVVTKEVVFPEIGDKRSVTDEITSEF